MKWICARAKIGSELAICAKLGVETFCPSHTATVRSARKERKVERAIFPGYFFARTEGFHEITSDPAVYGLISDADGPKSVPESVIEDLRARIGLNAFEPLLRQSEGKRQAFQSGATLLLESGLFERLTLLVEQDCGDVIKGTINGMKAEVPESSLKP